MKHEHDILERESGIPAHPQRAANLVSILVGAILGLATGFFAAAGLPGLVIGAVVGALLGFAVAQLSRRHESRHHATDW